MKKTTNDILGELLIIVRDIARDVELLKKDRPITIIDQRPISTTQFPICNCQQYLNTPTKPPCPVHGGINYPYTTC